MVHDLQVYLLMLPDLNTVQRQTQSFVVASLWLTFRGGALVAEQTCLQTPEANSLWRIMWSVVITIKSFCSSIYSTSVVITLTGTDKKAYAYWPETRLIMWNTKRMEIIQTYIHPYKLGIQLLLCSEMYVETAIIQHFNL